MEIFKKFNKGSKISKNKKFLKKKLGFKKINISKIKNILNNLFQKI